MMFIPDHLDPAAEKAAALRVLKRHISTLKRGGPRTLKAVEYHQGQCDGLSASAEPSSDPAGV